jgi:hypothetical protein
MKVDLIQGLCQSLAGLQEESDLLASEQEKEKKDYLS